MILIKKSSQILSLVIITSLTLFLPIFSAFAEEQKPPNYLQAVITADETAAIQKSTIFDASQSFLPDPDAAYNYEWEFGDGNKNEGVEVLHVYKNPGEYTVTLTIKSDDIESKTTKEVFVYKKMLLLLTDMEEYKHVIETINEYAKQQGVFIKIVDSFGQASEFISEEILTKKLTESVESLQKAAQIAVWTKENAGLNALSRFIQENKESASVYFSSKSIIVVTEDISGYSTRIKRQFQVLSPKNIIITNEAGIYPLIDNFTSKEYADELAKKGYEHEVITESTFQIRPWNFVSYFLSILTEKGVPDNTLALLLLLPVIATVVAMMKQLVGLTTMGIYTPIIITISFLIIGFYFGLFTLLTVLVIGGLTRHLLRKVKLLFIPKMAIVLTLVALTLILILITTLYLGTFNATFFSLAIFPMVILSTLVEKFVSIKTEKGLLSAVILMGETIVVSIVAFIVAGGEVGLGFMTIKWDFVRNLMLNFPELIFVLIGINILLGRWSGLRLLEFIRFREVLRHTEE